MAAGDAAAAAGLSVVPATKDIRLGYQDINIRGDELAAHITTGTHPFTKVTGTATVAQGGTGATTATGALANLGASAVGHTHDDRYYTETESDARYAPPGPYVRTVGNYHDTIRWSGTHMIYGADGVPEFELPNLAEMNAKRDAGDGNFGSTPIYTPSGRGNPVTSSYVAAYLNGDGRIGASASSRAFKNPIRTYVPPADLLDLVPVVYSFKDDPAATPRLGLYAEDTNEIEPLLVTHENDQPYGVKYDVIAVALLAVVKDQRSTISALSDRLRTIEQALGIEGVA
ncbi:hypothetical protein [Cellulomonas sp. SG140]|uniref:hypothetical protein n=1 Tax=Cellulomonas sp. SG140 TaxID=2976536 RepID=UPI0021E905FF|nr:hypothetical protein [Cellulomonas sp. SG140]